MTLREMSVEYRRQGLVLRERIRDLKEQGMHLEESWEKEVLDHRIRVLTRLWQENRELTVLLERYYERGYYRDERYTL